MLSVATSCNTLLVKKRYQLSKFAKFVDKQEKDLPALNGQLFSNENAEIKP
jgi:hypothetical protein